jgi:hypothetical protein
MTSSFGSTTQQVAAITLRWIARTCGLVSLALLAAFASSGGGMPTASEIVALGFFPIGVAIGLVVAWWREGLGGIITMASLALFYVWMWTIGRLPHGPYFFLFASPGLMFIASWCFDRVRNRPLPSEKRLTSS